MIAAALVGLARAASRSAAREHTQDEYALAGPAK